MSIEEKNKVLIQKQHCWLDLIHLMPKAYVNDDIGSVIRLCMIIRSYEKKLKIDL